MAARAKLMVVGTVVGAGVLGFLAGQRFAPATEDVAVMLPAVPQAVPQARTSQIGTTVQAEAKPVAISSLREILQLKSDFAQTTALYMLASRKDRKGIEELLKE